jgi:hypothetical protein
VGELLRVAQIVDRDDATIVEGKGHQNNGAQKFELASEAARMRGISADCARCRLASGPAGR